MGDAHHLQLRADVEVGRDLRRVVVDLLNRHRCRRDVASEIGGLELQPERVLVVVAPAIRIRQDLLALVDEATDLLRNRLLGDLAVPLGLGVDRAHDAEHDAAGTCQGGKVEQRINRSLHVLLVTVPPYRTTPTPEQPSLSRPGQLGTWGRAYGMGYSRESQRTSCRCGKGC